MDVNDIKPRLDRLYRSIDVLEDYDVRKHVRIEEVTDNNSAFTHRITFDNASDETGNTNMAMGVIEHLAKLKDHLKNRMGSSGRLVEDHINESFHLVPLWLQSDYEMNFASEEVGRREARLT